MADRKEKALNGFTDSFPKIQNAQKDIGAAVAAPFFCQMVPVTTRVAMPGFTV